MIVALFGWGGFLGMAFDRKLLSINSNKEYCIALNNQITLYVVLYNVSQVPSNFQGSVFS